MGFLGEKGLGVVTRRRRRTRRARPGAAARRRGAGRTCGSRPAPGGVWRGAVASSSRGASPLPGGAAGELFRADAGQGGVEVRVHRGPPGRGREWTRAHCPRHRPRRTHIGQRLGNGGPARRRGAGEVIAPTPALTGAPACKRLDTAMVRYVLLGPVELCHGGERRAAGGRRQQALLADLLVHANEAVSVDRLIDDVWGPERSDGSAKRLQMAVARLRSAIGPGPDGESPLRRTAHGYRLVVAPGELDVDVFERSVEDAREALRGGDPGRARALLRTALELWRGPPLADVSYEEFAQEAIHRLDERKLDAL